MCLSTDVVIKAGTNAPTLPTDADYDTIIEEAEDFLIAVTKSDLVTNWATISSGILSEYCARSGAIQVITYNMSGYTSRVEAEDMINVHLFRMGQIVTLLENSDVQDFLGI